MTTVSKFEQVFESCLPPPPASIITHSDLKTAFIHHVIFLFCLSVFFNLICFLP